MGVSINSSCHGVSHRCEHPGGDITTYTYNADGLRVREEHDGAETRFVYDGNNLLRETDDTNLPEADYTYIPQAYAEAISQRRDGDSSFYLADGIRNVRKLTDDAGLVTDEYAYDAFGVARSTTGSTPNSQQYKGQLLGYRRDPHAGPDTDYSTHHRNYNPKTGRFRSEDPAEDDLNLYRYVNNNPVNQEDPSGLEPYQFTEEEMQEGQPQRYAARLSTWIRKQGEASVRAIEADAAAYDRWQSTSFVWGLRIGVVQTGTSALAVVADPFGALWNVKTAIEQSADYGYHHSEGRTVDSMLLAGSHLTGVEKIYDAGDKRTLGGQILTTDEQTDLRMAGWSQALGVASLPAVPLSMSSLYRSGTVAAVAPRSTLNRATASNPFDDFNFQFTAEIPPNNFGTFRIDVSPRSIVTQKGALSPVPAASPVLVVARPAQNSVGTYTTKIKWGIHEIDARPAGPGFWGKRIPQSNPRVDAFELKINPNGESYYLPHPEGGFVQFENLTASAVQDGKLIMQPRSLYHVDDLPAFAQNKVIAEAERQIAAAKQAGFQVEWLVSDAKAASQLEALFKSTKISISITPFAE